MVLRCALLLAAVLLTAFYGAPVEAQVLSFYRIRASVRTVDMMIDGTAQLRFRNPSQQAITELRVVLFANRFARETNDAGVDDFNRPFVYPYQDFDPGWMQLSRARVDGQELPVVALEVPDAPPDSLQRLVLSRPLAPGEEVEIELEFVTRLPNRFGTFGHFDGQITALGGWYPYVAQLGEDGAWQLDAPPPLADFSVDLRFDADEVVVLNGRESRVPVRQFALDVPRVRYLTLAAAPDLEREEITAGNRRAAILSRPPGWSYTRVALPPRFPEIRREVLEQVIEENGGPGVETTDRGVSATAEEPLVFLVAPLRLHLTAPGEGMVVISDRALRVHWLLRGFHQREIDAAARQEELRGLLSRREPPQDYEWVGEGLGHELARRHLEVLPLPRRTVQDWIELFNIFAVVDRFETAPKIPFVETFFAKVPLRDPLHEQVTTFNNSLPPGFVVFDKLRQRVGDERFEALLDHCDRGEQAFRPCVQEELRAAGGESGEEDFFEQWVRPLPRINYRVVDKQLNQPTENGFVQRVEIERQSDWPVREPVDVRFDPLFGEPADMRWEGAGSRATVERRTDEKMHQVVLDPERQLMETTRADNASPPIPQLVLDTAEVEVSSTEFSVAGTVVARGRYDYRKDLALTGYFTNRSVGATFGPRYHWGTANDENSYRHNFYGFYRAEWLDRGFDDESRPGFHTSGHIGGFGLRYDYNDIFWYDNPTRSTHVRLFADIFDHALGSDFDFADWGWSGSFTHPLWSYRTIAALDLFNGFSQALDGSEVPNQSRFSLGGSRSIRGIGAEEKLGRNLFLVRAELRQAIYPEFDHNLADFLILRRTQVHVFADTGEVDSSAGRIYDPTRWAVGVGVGFGLIYELMGLYPATFYIEVATRVDHKDDLDNVQVLFGTRQPF